MGLPWAASVSVPYMDSAAMNTSTWLTTASRGARPRQVISGGTAGAELGMFRFKEVRPASLAQAQPCMLAVVWMAILRGETVPEPTNCKQGQGSP
jgi:hypothetical protein